LREAQANSGTANAISRVIRFLFWAVLINGALWLLRRSLSAGKSRERRAAAPVPPAAAPIQLHRDPICGTHVSSEISFTLEASDGKKHFCSTECRDRFQRSQRRAASA
jgi:YHS domain-containing protein